MNMDLLTIAVLAMMGIVVIAAVAVIAAKAANGNTRAGSVNTSARRPMGPMSPHELEHQVHAMLDDGKMIPAIKLVREQTGLGLKEAKDLVDGAKLGRRIIDHPAVARLTGGPQPFATPGRTPAPGPALGQADLASRVRELKSAGRTEQAIFLVRGETGMEQADAEHFVESIT